MRVIFKIKTDNVRKTFVFAALFQQNPYKRSVHSKQSGFLAMADLG